MKRALIADDDPVMVGLLEHNLSKNGFEVFSCKEGLSVKSAADKANPDIIILDVILPGKSGFDLIKEFKNDPYYTKVPIIMVTEQGKDSTHKELLKTGASQVFTKPFSPNALNNAINQLLTQL